MVGITALGFFDENYTATPGIMRPLALSQIIGNFADNAPIERRTTAIRRAKRVL
jgi:hypothetical protein